MSALVTEKLHFRMWCRTCNSNLVHIGSSRLQATLHLNSDGTYLIDTSEFACKCLDLKPVPKNPQNWIFEVLL